MTTATKPDTALVTLGAEETALLAGDISKLNEAQRADLVASICRSLGLNPLTNPFRYIPLGGKLTLYATKDCTDQLRRIYRVSTRIVGREMLPGEIYCVTAQALLPDGRSEERIGAVSIAGLKGENMANALMKCETKAVRRVTLGACGLGFLDETEVETIPGAAQWLASPAPVPQLAQTNGEAPERVLSTEEEGALPAPAKWRPELAHMSGRIKILTGEDVAVPVQMTRAEGRALKARLVELLAEAEARFAAQRNAPAVADHVDPPDESLPF